MAKAKGEFEVASWNEDTYEEREGGGKLTRASVGQKFTGDVDGDGAAEWLMCYRDDGTADFVGLQRVDGSIDDRSGSFVLETIGEFDGKVAKWTAAVVPGTGSGELAGLGGDGRFEAPMGSTASFELEYELG